MIEPSRSDLLQLWANVQNLFLRLPQPHSSYKHEHVYTLLSGVSTDGARQISGISASSTLSRYRNEMPPTGIRLLETHYREGVTRNVSGEEVVSIVTDLREKYNAAKSGDKVGRVATDLSLSQVYLRYKADGGAAGKMIFFRACKEAHLLHTKHDRFDFFACSVCLRARDEILRLYFQQESLLQTPGHKPEELLRLRCQLLELQNHIDLDRLQQYKCREIRDTLQPNQLLIVMDFGAHQVKEKGLSRGNRYGDLIFVLYWKQDGVLMWEYFDCIPALTDDLKDSKDINFVQTALLTLVEVGRFVGFTEWFVWSDTGPNHFRTSNTLYFFSVLQSRLRAKIHVCFFFPQHGHSAADRHHGSSKKHLRYVLKHLAYEYKIPDRSLLVSSLQECKNTTVVNLPPIKTHQKVVRTLEGITKYLVFEFPMDSSSDGLDVDCRTHFKAPPVRLRFSLVGK